jgi:hypothetical protein
MGVKITLQDNSTRDFPNATSWEVEELTLDIVEESESDSTVRTIASYTHSSWKIVEAIDEEDED